jgi:hypothetical protein
MACVSINNMVDEWGRVIFFGTRLIEILEVSTYINNILFLFDWGKG